MTPQELRLTLAHVSRDAEQFATPQERTSGKLREVSEMLMDEGMIDTDCVMTERMRIYIQALCAVPFPVSKWVMPNEEQS